MYLAKTNELLSSMIPTITTTHTSPFIYTLLPSICYPTLSTTKHEMDLLPKDVTPPILPVLENNTLFQNPHPLSTPSVIPRDANLSNPSQSRETGPTVRAISPPHPKHGIKHPLLNILRTGDADLRFYITTVQDGWRKSAFLTRACLPRTINLIMQYIEPVSEWFC